MLSPLLSLLMLLSLSCGRSQPLPETADLQALRRAEMVTTQLEARDIHDSRILEVMGRVPRHLFVPPVLREYAYQDSPLPIGEDQTISQPYIVALMTQLARPKREHRALEIGTGSGYQAAVLAGLVDQVYTIEIVPALAERSSRLLNELGLSNVHVRHGDGYAGWPDEAPFDLILITAAAPTLPQPLLDQLADGGRLVVPVGSPGGFQELTLIEKKGGKIARRSIIPVRFVPMTGQVQRP